MTDLFCSGDVEIIAQKAADKAVNNVLLKLGINPEDWHETQQDMQHLRQQRKATEKVTLAVRVSLILTITSGLISLIWVGIQNTLKT